MITFDSSGTPEWAADHRNGEKLANASTARSIQQQNERWNSFRHRPQQSTIETSKLHQIWRYRSLQKQRRLGGYNNRSGVIMISLCSRSASRVQPRGQAWPGRQLRNILQEHSCSFVPLLKQPRATSGRWSSPWWESLLTVGRFLWDFLSTVGWCSWPRLK